MLPTRPYPPIPIYVPEREGAHSPLRQDYPFQLIGYHCRQRTHSSFANLTELNAIAAHEMQINPLDADHLGIRSGERVLVESERGRISVVVRVTPRIMPGVVALPQGAWHDADMEGDRLDRGACINTLTSSRPTALAHGNAQNTILVRIVPLKNQEGYDMAPLIRNQVTRNQLMHDPSTHNQLSHDQPLNDKGGAK